jgi:hypothetical protein
MKPEFLQPIEKGSANIRVELKGGFIRVYHVETGEELHKRIARQGDWADLWKELSRADRNGIGVLSVIETIKQDRKELFYSLLFCGVLFVLFKLAMLFTYIFS